MDLSTVTPSRPRACYPPPLTPQPWQPALKTRAKELTLIDIAKVKPVTYSGIERVEKFLQDAGTYYLATTEGDQPRVRPFGTAHIYEGRLYIQTGKVKDVSKQLHANPKAELTAFKDGGVDPRSGRAGRG